MPLVQESNVITLGKTDQHSQSVCLPKLFRPSWVLPLPGDCWPHSKDSGKGIFLMVQIGKCPTTRPHLPPSSLVPQGIPCWSAILSLESLLGCYRVSTLCSESVNSGDQLVQVTPEMGRKQSLRKIMRGCSETRKSFN